MAFGAVGRELRGRVIRISRAIVFVTMATRAVCRQRSDAARMAYSTIEILMPARQRECIGMRERRVLPILDRVALRTFGREVGRRVVRLGNRVVIVAMTTHAIGGNRSRPAFVTLRTIETAVAQG